MLEFTKLEHIVKLLAKFGGSLSKNPLMLRFQSPTTICSRRCGVISLLDSSMIEKLSCNNEGSDGAAYMIHTHNSKFLKRNLTAIRYWENTVLFQKCAAHFLDITQANPDPFILSGALEAQWTTKLSSNIW